MSLMKSQKLIQNKYPLYIYGAGGHGKVVLDAAISNKYLIKGFLDDDNNKWKSFIVDYPILGDLSSIEGYEKGDMRIIVAIGDNRNRFKKVNDVIQKGYLFQSVVHKKAIISSYSFIGQGSMIIAGVVINIGTQVGKHVIINTGATVDHDCKINDFVHVAPGVHIGGEVQVGEGTLVGIGSVVKPGINIGSWSIIGAGAVVVEDIPAGVVAVGVPARVIRRVEER